MELEELKRITDFLTVVHATKMSTPRIILLNILREIELKEVGNNGVPLSAVPFTPVGELEARYREKTRNVNTAYRYESMREMCHKLTKFGMLIKSHDGRYVEYRLAKLGRQYLYMVESCMGAQDAHK